MQQPANHHLAQLNIGRIRYEIDDPRMADFTDNLAMVNGLAERTPGFVWRYIDESGNSTSTRPYSDPRIAINLSVWESVEALERFVYQTIHKRFYGRRAEWFEHFEGPYFVMWWVPAGHRPERRGGSRPPRASQAERAERSRLRLAGDRCAALENGALCAERVGSMTANARHLAQFNIARIRYPLNDPRMREFVENVERVNGLADKIEGFVWRLKDESGHAMNMRVYDDPTILPNLTVWENVEALERFVWQTLHRRFFSRREEWFAPVKTTLVLVVDSRRTSARHG